MSLFGKLKDRLKNKYNTEFKDGKVETKLTDNLSIFGTGGMDNNIDHTTQAKKDEKKGWVGLIFRF